MIRQSFIFLPKLTRNAEQRIWNHGIKDWNSFIDAKNIPRISQFNKLAYDKHLKNASKALLDYDSSFFNNMSSADAIRLYDFFKDDAVFLDIETTSYHGDITVVGLYDNFETKSFVKGFSLDKNILKKQLSKYKLIVTFNGASFDLPVIRKYFGNILPNVPHLDLRHACRRIDLTGGLKLIEKEVGIKRPDNLSTLGGDDAVWLWKAWKASGEKRYLDTLVAYNEEDIVNLKPLADHCYKKTAEQFLSCSCQ